MRGIYTESQHEHYDVIVVGAGLAGLSCALLLAKAGKSVLIVERHDRVGGYAHGFKRKGFHFDSGVHLVSSCGEDGYQHGKIINRICKAGGIDWQQLFIPVDDYAQAYFPDLQVPFFSGEAAFVEGLTQHFPHEKTGLLKLMRLCKTLAEEAMQAEEILELGKTSAQAPSTLLANLFQYRRASLAQALDEFLTEPRLKSACATLWPYMGLPPERLSFLYWASMMAGYTYEGSYYCRGSFQQYANQLADAIKNLGGEVLLNASVRRIVVDNGKISGVVLENNQRISADVVVSNVDARMTAEQLIGIEHLPSRFWQRLKNLKPSMSIFASYIGTDLPIAASRHSHESFYYPTYDLEDLYQRSAAGQQPWFSVTLPTLTDASLAPEGLHILMLTTLCPFDVGQSWRSAKAEFEHRLLEQAEQQFPGLKEHILVMESGSPRTLERYTLNGQGAAYGFAATPEQIGPNRPSVIGPLPGLFFTGHWSRPGGGVAGVSISAVLAAQAILGVPSQLEFWGELEVK